jgi:predicted Zn-dependent protease
MTWQTDRDPEKLRGWLALLGFVVVCALTLLYLVRRSSRDVLDLDPAAEAALGTRLMARLEELLPRAAAPAAEHLVRKTGRELANRSPHGGLPIHFVVLNAVEINAFALPGGYVCVNRGLIEAVEDEEELAGVLAHEIVHVERRHAAEALRRASFLEAFFKQLGGPEAAPETGGAQVIALGMFLNFSHAQEEQADRGGVELLHASGHDPRGLIRFFRRIATLQKGGSSGLGEFFDPHGRPDLRIRWVHEEMERLGAKPLVIPPFSNLEAAQAELRAQSPPPLFDPQALARAFEEEVKTGTGSESPTNKFGSTEFMEIRCLSPFCRSGPSLRPSPQEESGGEGGSLF